MRFHAARTQLLCFLCRILCICDWQRLQYRGARLWLQNADCSAATCVSTLRGHRLSAALFSLSLFMHLRRISRLAAKTLPRSCGYNLICSPSFFFISLFLPFFFFLSFLFHAKNRPVKRDIRLPSALLTSRYSDVIASC